MKIKKYRVWHTDKKHCSKFDEREVSEVASNNLKKAKELVQNMFPTHRITSAWLIEK